MPKKDEGFRTVAREGSGEFTERKSRFIGYIAPAREESEARDFIETVRLLHPEANHHVWSYIQRGGAVVRASDDGEPSGTAGRPVTEVLQREGLNDVVCVVVRYFGGILLGAGGLIRAYAQGARVAVENAEKAHMTPMKRLSATVPYHFYGKITSRLSRMGLTPETPEFSESVRFLLTVSPEGVEGIRTDLADLTAGQAVIEDAGEVWLPVPEDPGE